MTEETYNKILEKINSLLVNESLRTQAILKFQSARSEEKNIFDLAIKKASEIAEQTSAEIMELLKNEVKKDTPETSEQ